jgi:hypothetical protein
VNHSVRFEKPNVHRGVVVSTSESGFDCGVASFCSIFVDFEDPHTIYLFYAGGKDERMIHSSIGLASSHDGFKFMKTEQPVLTPQHGSFCYGQTITPLVTRISNKFFMVIAGKPSPEASRRLGIAFADDPKGPWHIIGELIRPEHLWEGNGIDNGPSVAKLDDETFLLYYSSITSPKSYDIGTLVRRYPVRRIGVLKVRVRGTSLSNIEVMRFSGNPLKHLNGPKGSWNESVFCPGYVKLGDKHYLFPSGSTYSVGYPYRQYIGAATSSTPYFDKKDTQPTKLIDGPKEKAQILPNAKSEIALDTPCPYLAQEKLKLHLYYSVADRADEKWKIALTTYDLHSKIE